MRICGICRRQSPDHVTTCPKCGADLLTKSATALALARLRENRRIREVRILGDRNCCPICRDQIKAYPIDQVPALPIEGCSHGAGCRCVYEPVLDLAGP